MLANNDFLTMLEEEGYAVIPGILNPEECDKLIIQIWDFLESLGSGIKRDDPTTWVKNFPKTEKGIVKGLQIGHQQFAWDIRQHPNVVEVFKQIWEDSDLVTSFDAVNIQFPPEYGGDSEETYGELYHVDQSCQTKGRQYIQGTVNLEDQGAEDGGFSCWPRSHKYFDLFYQAHGYQVSPDFFVHRKSELQWFAAQGLRKKKIEAPKGSIILWDSRTIHQGTLPKKNRTTGPKVRYAVYVCQVPRRYVWPENLINKIALFEALLLTNHQSKEAKRDNYDYSPKYKLPNKVPSLTEVGRRLVGYEK